MSELTDSKVQSIVRSELSNIHQDVKRIDSLLSRIEDKLNDLRNVQTEVHQAVMDINQLQQQTRNIPNNLNQTVTSIQQAIEDIKSRTQRAEESSKYTAGYVAMRLKERYERGM
jgi:t-SNARE complex subunit (syntaxin)